MGKEENWKGVREGWLKVFPQTPSYCLTLLLEILSSCWVYNRSSLLVHSILKAWKLFGKQTGDRGVCRLRDKVAERISEFSVVEVQGVLPLKLGTLKES